MHDQFIAREANMSSCAGIDCGTSLLKAYWREGNEDRFLTVGYAEEGQKKLLEALVAAGVERVRCVGTGISRLRLHGTLGVLACGSIDDEIHLQSCGARHLLARSGQAVPWRILVVSVGTGVSYAAAFGKRIMRSPIGSSHGGGTVMGLAGLLGISSFDVLQENALHGSAPDRLVKDELPDTAGTPVGDLVVSHFARPGASLQDRCAGIFSLSATSVCKDIAIITALPFMPKQVVVVGTLGSSEAFRVPLSRFIPQLERGGVALHFPRHGAYAAAVGAWHATDF